MQHTANVLVSFTLSNFTSTGFDIDTLFDRSTSGGGSESGTARYGIIAIG
jgi:hypothetical protein